VIIKVHESSYVNTGLKRDFLKLEFPDLISSSEILKPTGSKLIHNGSLLSKESKGITHLEIRVQVKYRKRMLRAEG
jgi:hypothetical protein